MIKVKDRERKRCQLTLQEIAGLPSDVRAFKSVGKAFILSTKVRSPPFPFPSHVPPPPAPRLPSAPPPPSLPPPAAAQPLTRPPPSLPPQDKIQSDLETSVEEFGKGIAEAEKEREYLHKSVQDVEENMKELLRSSPGLTSSIAGMIR